MGTHGKKDVYQIITEIIIERIEKGSIPWRRSWSAFGPASNYTTKKPYQGINYFILNSFSFEYPFFLTFKQAHDLGGSVKKGSKSLPVTYWNFIYTDKESKRRVSPEEAKNLPANRVWKAAFLKYYSVFNIADVEGITFEFPDIEVKPDNEVIHKCEVIVNDMPLPPAIVHGGNQPYYSPFKDYINMPEIKYFRNSEAYHTTLFHELIHATGHKTRLGRLEIMEDQAFDSDQYSKEELTAEMGACYLANIAGIDSEATLEDSAAYIQNWLRVLRTDKRFIIEAAAKAQKAVNYIIKKGK